MELGSLTFNPLPTPRRFSRDAARPPLELVPREPSLLRAWQRDRTRGRELSRAELEALVDDLAGRPELWRSQVRHSPEERIYVRLAGDEHVEIWLICWCPAQDTGFHDHDRSRGAVAVVEGRLRETLLAACGEHPTRTYGAGERFSFGATRVHDVQHVGMDPATSLHAYSPPLGEMGFYELGADGTVTRRAGDHREDLC